ncbi:MAG: hypothetical protein LBH38_04355, partial [Holosporales bacterium]|nr:hypothetical protein [Holosporales bacterium]
MKIKQNIGKFFALNLCLLSADPSAFGMNSPTDSEEEGLDLSEINQKFTFGFKTTNSEDEDSGIKQFEIDFSQNPGMTSSEEEDSGLSYADSKAQEDLMFSRPLLYLIINYRNIFQQSGMDGCKQKMVDVLADHHASLFGNLFHNYDINTIKSILSGTHRE